MHKSHALMKSLQTLHAMSSWRQQKDVGALLVASPPWTNFPPICPAGLLPSSSDRAAEEPKSCWLARGLNWYLLWVACQQGNSSPLLSSPNGTPLTYFLEQWPKWEWSQERYPSALPTRTTRIHPKYNQLHSLLQRQQAFIHQHFGNTVRMSTTQAGGGIAARSLPCDFGWLYMRMGPLNYLR